MNAVNDFPWLRRLAADQREGALHIVLGKDFYVQNR